MDLAQQGADTDLFCRHSCKCCHSRCAFLVFVTWLHQLVIDCKVEGIETIGSDDVKVLEEVWCQVFELSEPEDCLRPCRELHTASPTAWRPGHSGPLFTIVLEKACVGLRSLFHELGLLAWQTPRLLRRRFCPESSFNHPSMCWACHPSTEIETNPASLKRSKKCLAHGGDSAVA